MSACGAERKLLHLVGGVFRRGFRLPFGGWLEVSTRSCGKLALFFLRRGGGAKLLLAPKLPKVNVGWCSPAWGFLVAGVAAGDDFVSFELHRRRDDERRRLIFRLGRGGNAFVVNRDGVIIWVDRRTPAEFVGAEVDLGELSPIEGEPEDPTTAIGQGLRAFEEAYDELVGKVVRRALKLEIKRTRRALEAVRRDYEKLGDPNALRRTADTIMANLTRIPKGASEIEVEDPYGGGVVRLELDPRLEPQVFAQRLYARARRAERGRREARKRYKSLLRKLAGLSRLSQISDHNVVAQELGLDLSDILGEPVAERREQKPPPGTRRFVIDGYEVLVGRSAEANNRLTFQIAARDDIWLHAEGVKGAHVVIRCAGRYVPREVIHKAARIAAAFSDAKHASLAPVIFTRRRYVHPIKGKPGLVRTDRGETIFVEPGIPEGS